MRYHESWVNGCKKWNILRVNEILPCPGTLSPISEIFILTGAPLGDLFGRAGFFGKELI